MSRKQKWPDAYVTAQDWNGHTLGRIELKFRYPDQEQIAEAKRTLIERHGPDTRTFVNVYC